MNRSFYFLFTIILFFYLIGAAQTHPAEGLRDNTPSVYAFTNATIIVSPGNMINDATLVIRNGVIVAAGENINPPADAWVIDMKGKSIYPGFIDMWAEIGLPEPDSERGRELRSLNIPPEYAEIAALILSGNNSDAVREGALHWNPQVRSWFDAASVYKHDEEKIKRLRQEGFVMANAVPSAGIFRGRTALVSLGHAEGDRLVIKPNVSQAMSFEKSTLPGERYPTSLMGSISLIRQTWYDAIWYRQAWNEYEKNPVGLERPELNLALESLGDATRKLQPVLLDTENEIALLRASDMVAEFDLDMWVRGSGYEYRRIEAVRDTGIPLILPLSFPETPDVESPENAMNVSLEELRHWDFAPENPGKLNRAGIKIALTSSGLKAGDSFLEKLRIAVERGLDQDAALAAITVTPAELLGVAEQFGSVEAGKIASFIITDGPIFEPETSIEEVWVDGVKFEIEVPTDPDVRGKWNYISADNGDMELEIKGSSSGLNGSLTKNDKAVKLESVKSDKHRLNIVFKGDSLGIEGKVRISAPVSDSELFGIGELPDGSFFNWKAERISGHNKQADTNSIRKDQMSEGVMLYPSMEYGFKSIPKIVEDVIVKNATIWTQGPLGILDKGDMHVRNGRIVNVGTDLVVPAGAVLIDGTGKHVSPGLVDPHLHSSIKGGVNEVGNNMTPETRVSDVIEPDNIWVYRLLAGGMTTANLLHGSANPVGGQDAVVKMRWGALPGDFLLEGAKPGLKLALGENVVRNSNQYPNTRMGAEQIIRDAFQAAEDYIKEWEQWNLSKTGIPPRKDLQLEAMAEVLRGERIIHAHAYRQDEMQMLMRLAEDMGFHIASFEHTVEGYKIADILREHGAAAIIWTDWSSFKVESADGILYNARMLIEQGVLTSLHSDNTQLSTRMNWEAGKMMATGIDEVDAMDLITINPARIIGADKLVGSLEPGKHADFVIWSGHPLSGFTHAEQTWVDGRKYFDRESDQVKRKEVKSERALLIQKALATGKGNSGQSRSGK